ncbi:phage major capsid protein [Muricoccus nepalensis]|uniref:phage major capsid protein n=1 Tax=Muricoccus nepalensis TaxID=1854500 RepID=UPI0013873A42|nr:phage major capsid protein [Roseomonas nepalensis]
MTLREMLERRSAIAAELRALNDKPSGDNGDLSREQRARWDAHKTELDTLEQRIDRQSTLDEAERRAAGTPLGGTGDRDFDRAFAGIGLLDTMRAQMGAADERAARARELSQEVERRSGRRAEGLFWDMRLGNAEQRVLTTALPSGGPGGNLIAADYRPEQFIDRLRNATVVRRLGARVLAGLTGGNVILPGLSKSVQAGWVAENSPFPVSDPEFNGVTLAPKHLGVITELSRNMLQQTSPDAEQLVRDDQARVLAEGLDVAAIAGTGTNNQPRGVLNTPGIGSVAIGANGGALTYDALADLIGAVDDANATGGNMAFLSNTKVRRAAGKLKDTAGNPLGLATVFQATPQAFTNAVPSTLTKGTGTNLSPVIYGNWSDLVIAFWSELDVLVNPYAEGPYSRGNVMVRTALTCDIGVRHPESFAAIKDIAA